MQEFARNMPYNTGLLKILRGGRHFNVNTCKTLKALEGLESFQDCSHFLFKALYIFIPFHSEPKKLGALAQGSASRAAIDSYDRRICPLPKQERIEDMGIQSRRVCFQSKGTGLRTDCTCPLKHSAQHQDSWLFSFLKYWLYTISMHDHSERSECRSQFESLTSQTGLIESDMLKHEVMLPSSHWEEAGSRSGPGNKVEKSLSKVCFI